MRIAVHLHNACYLYDRVFLQYYPYLHIITRKFDSNFCKRLSFLNGWGFYNKAGV